MLPVSLDNFVCMKGVLVCVREMPDHMLQDLCVSVMRKYVKFFIKSLAVTVKQLLFYFPVPKHSFTVPV